MFAKELIIFSFIFLFIRFLWKNYRKLYLAWKIPNSEFDMSLKALWDYYWADAEGIFKAITHGNSGPLAKTWFGHVLAIIISSPEDVKIVMNSKECLDKPSYLRICVKLIKGTVFGNIQQWHTHRKLLAPFFGLNTIRTFIPMFNARTESLVKSLRNEDGRGEFDVFYYTASMTLESVLNLMEYDIDIQSMEKPDKFTVNLKKAFELTGTRTLKFWLHPEFIYSLTKNYSKEMEARSRSYMLLTSKIIVNVRKNMKNDSDNHKSFMRAMLNPRINFKQDEIVDEVDTLIMAGHETTALALSSTLLLLAMNKDVQDRVHDELMSVIGKPSDDLFIDFDQTNKFEYLEMVIHEAIRLLPAIPVIVRTNEEELTSSEGYIIPAKSTLFVPIFNIHRNKKFWGDDADEFKPSRFSKDEMSKIHPYAYLPFTKGPRMCIAWRYGMILMKIQLAKILLNYKLDTKLKLNELEFKYNITMAIKSGYQISIVKRNY